MEVKEETSSKHTFFNFYYSFSIIIFLSFFYSAIKCGLIYYSALYHLHLVKAETARAFIPIEFRLVEAFGY